MPLRECGDSETDVDDLRIMRFLACGNGMAMAPQAYVDAVRARCEVLCHRRVSLSQVSQPAVMCVICG
ncbi:hypothetical protein NDU88_006328 [Pleurodeles waltl]|uniref:Uncharacterized protein n=1 Tax=Pleurodeles waltl TaxID=8319 RepID=A0AAV7WD97_PLEWA|nr:hypothetical protein NDU88_006328 [Pleurodeles waltl]